ncbi:hypothetical protein [Streptomyces radicis]|uniref:hypothetical protein n=1 Tax=Streptomyces radicis TaxID=1750517 RepID=UPI0016024A22|nr:hypothetical protein [Streptomyces radicis]
MVSEGHGPYWERHDTGSTGFLAALLTGRRQSEILDDLSDPDHRFDPLPTTSGP